MSDDLNEFTLISFANIDATQKSLIHAEVKRTALTWWHQQETVWIVQGGGSVLEWRDRLAPFTRGISDSAILLLSLPREVNWRGWATTGASDYATWIKSTYRPEVEPQADKSLTS